MRRITLVLVVLMAGTAPALACSYSSGQHVVLASDVMDPDVFVWDSRQRAVDYAQGHWRNTRDVMDHTVLVKPGTRAVIIACAPKTIPSRYAQRIEDALGLRIIEGPSRGRYGWVYAEDAHLESTQARR